VTYEPAARALNDLLENDTIARIWRRDVSVWTKDPGGEDARSIASRLGWLDVPTGMQPEAGRVRSLADEVARDGISQVYLLGMGGSSLCAEVMRSVYGVSKGHVDLSVMDTTDEAAIVAVLDRLEPRRTLFLVSSKSGGTIEPASMERLYWQRMARELGDWAGRHFVAVTDPGTALADLAKTRGYRHIALNPPDIGGRF
jgi:glucose-6-phosphate isomerase